MILVQIATALAIGTYVVLSKDAQPKRPGATARESSQHPADHLLDRPTARVVFSWQVAGAR
jgi:hypothetical protein